MGPLISVITPSHDPRWLADCYASLKAQTFESYEWCITLTGDARRFEVPSEWTDGQGRPPRVHRLPIETKRVGLIKSVAFRQGRGSYLLELDHDDLLEPEALWAVEKAARNTQAVFLYSDAIDWSPEGEPVTYHNADRRLQWEQCGWRFGEALGGELYPISWEPSAAALSLIYYAPNHLRCWHRDFYEMIGGHSPERAVCDDHELLIRTYLHGEMHHIPEPLYRYRVSGDNTWLRAVEDIRGQTYALRDQYQHQLVEREMRLRGLPCYDLGGALGSPGSPWIPVDIEPSAGVQHDLRDTPWPFDDGSVGAFRAADLLEHLPDKLGAMREIHRCLAPGGWLLARTPSADTALAHRDPTHVSYWVEDSFRYHTDPVLNQFLPTVERHVRFNVGRLTTQGGYVIANLYKDAPGVPRKL